MRHEPRSGGVRLDGRDLCGRPARRILLSVCAASALMAGGASARAGTWFEGFVSPASGGADPLRFTGNASSDSFVDRGNGDYAFYAGAFLRTGLVQVAPKPGEPLRIEADLIRVDVPPPHDAGPAFVAWRSNLDYDRFTATGEPTEGLCLRLPHDGGPIELVRVTGGTVTVLAAVEQPGGAAFRSIPVRLRVDDDGSLVTATFANALGSCSLSAVSSQAFALNSVGFLGRGLGNLFDDIAIDHARLPAGKPGFVYERRGFFGAPGSLYFEDTQITDAPGGARDRWPAVSPDGSTVAFRSNRSGANELWIAHIDGSDIRQATDLASQGLAFDSESRVAWDPAAPRIIFEAGTEGGGLDLYAYGLDDGAVTPFFGTPGVDDREPAFNRDGSVLTFTIGSDLYSMGRDAAPSPVLVKAGGSSPAWSPDGDLLYFDAALGGYTLLGDPRAVVWGQGAGADFGPGGGAIEWLSDYQAGFLRPMIGTFWGGRDTCASPGDWASAVVAATPVDRPILHLRSGAQTSWEVEAGQSLGLPAFLFASDLSFDPTGGRLHFRWADPAVNPETTTFEQSGEYAFPLVATNERGIDSDPLDVVLHVSIRQLPFEVAIASDGGPDDVIATVEGDPCERHGHGGGDGPCVYGFLYAVDGGDLLQAEDVGYQPYFFAFRLSVPAGSHVVRLVVETAQGTLDQTRTVVVRCAPAIVPTPALEPVDGKVQAPAGSLDFLLSEAAPLRYRIDAMPEAQLAAASEAHIPVPCGLAAGEHTLTLVTTNTCSETDAFAFAFAHDPRPLVQLRGTSCDDGIVWLPAGASGGELRLALSVPSEVRYRLDRGPEALATVAAPPLELVVPVAERGIHTIEVIATSLCPDGAIGTAEIAFGIGESPAVALTLTPEPNEYGWANADVTLDIAFAPGEVPVISTWAYIQTWTGFDLIGLPYHAVLSAQTYYTVNAWVTDCTGAGSGGLRFFAIDKLAPVVTVSLDRTPNASGWIGGPAPAVACADAVDPIPEWPETASFILEYPSCREVPEGRDQTVSMAARDVAGNVGVGSITGVNADYTPPVVQCPAQVEVMSDDVRGYAGPLAPAVATDALSGIAEVSSDAPGILPFGTTVVTWRATDNAGNETTCSQEVRVTLGVSGLKAPLASLVLEGSGPPPLPARASRAGSTLPLKLQILRGTTPLRRADLDASGLNPPALVALTRDGAPVDLPVVDDECSHDEEAGFRSAGASWTYELETRGLGAGTWSGAILMPDGRRWAFGFVLR